MKEMKEREYEGNTCKKCQRFMPSLRTFKVEFPRSNNNEIKKGWSGSIGCGIQTVDTRKYIWLCNECYQAYIENPVQFRIQE